MAQLSQVHDVAGDRLPADDSLSRGDSQGAVYPLYQGSRDFPEYSALVCSLYPSYVGEYMNIIQIRKSQGVGVLIICPDDRVESRIAYLDAGADICLAASAHPREIEANLRSMARRNTFRTGVRRKQSFRKSHWVFDTLAWELISPFGHRIGLTAIEYRLMRELWSDAGSPVSRESLARAMGKPQNLYTDRSLDAVVSRLRRKIESETGLPPPIRAARNVGYAFIG